MCSASTTDARWQNHQGPVGFQVQSAAMIKQLIFRAETKLLVAKAFSRCSAHSCDQVPAPAVEFRLVSALRRQHLSLCCKGALPLYHCATTAPDAVQREGFSIDFHN